MNLTLLTGGNTSLDLSFFMDDLQEALATIDLGEGSPISPIDLDKFVENRLTGIPVIKNADELTLCLKQNTSNLSPKIVFVQLQNVTKNHSGFMDTAAWGEIFDLKSNKCPLIVAPNGILYVEADSDGICHLKPKSKINTIILSYETVISFDFDNRTVYGKIDPLIKVTSGGE